MIILLICLAACNPAPSYMIEEYALNEVNWEGDWLEIKSEAGSMEEILAKYETERAKPAPEFSNTLQMGSDTYSAVENYTGNQVSVDVLENDKSLLSVQAGVISPINNFRGLWSFDNHWVMEVVHVEEDPADPNAAFIIWGEIFQDGESLNEKYGYEEAFNFTILNGESFYFIKKDGKFGYVYAGDETDPGYTHIPHYQCCSAGAFNPVAYENIITAFASRGEKDFFLVITAK